MDMIPCPQPSHMFTGPVGLFLSWIAEVSCTCCQDPTP